MKKILMFTLLVAALSLTVAGYKYYSPTAVASPIDTSMRSKIIEDVLNTARSVDIEKLPALDVPRLTLPAAGVDILRIKMQGTYSIDGIGTETVDLSGWLACVHNDARPAFGGDEITWKNSIIDTEFVGFEIRGESKIFGPVIAYLDSAKRSYGQTGTMIVPAVPEGMRAARGSCCPPTPQCPPPPECSTNDCVAVMNLVIEMPQLGLKMKTREPIRNYSYVETVPPVGAVPSFTVEQTALVLDGRVVGSLRESASKFREVVMKVPFNSVEVAQR